MEQMTKTRHRQDDGQEVEHTPTEVNETSQEVLDETDALLAEVDAALAEQDAQEALKRLERDLEMEQMLSRWDDQAEAVEAVSDTQGFLDSLDKVDKLCVC